MSDQDCLFCKFAKGEITVEIIAENDGAIAFSDINAQAPIHALVIPRKHFENAAQLATSAFDLQAVMQLVGKVAELKNLAAGYRLVFNTGAAAGQTVFHAHGHVLGGRSLQWPPG
jgi:histidine triad (HIT) family protein